MSAAGARAQTARRHGPRAAGPNAPEVTRVLHRVAATMRAHDMVPSGGLVLAAVSGGQDSLCLLHALAGLRRLLGIEVACFHFDHALRGGSERDTAFVRSQAARLGVAFRTQRAQARPPRGSSVEAWARTVRYDALRRAASELGAAAIATGHTLDDQAETVLMACLRGGGLDALAGIACVAGDLVRPLLEVRRDETEAFCRALALRARRDEMNDDVAFLRVALRHGVLPEIERATGRGVAEPIARSARLLGEDARFLDGLAAVAAEEVREDGADGRISLRAAGLSALPRPIASRVVRAALAGDGSPAEAAHIAAILDLAAGRPGRRATLAAGLLACRDSEYVRLFHASEDRDA